MRFRSEPTTDGAHSVSQEIETHHLNHTECWAEIVNKFRICTKKTTTVWFLGLFLLSRFISMESHVECNICE